MTHPHSLTPDYIAERWPRLYHMAEAGSWASIEQHGLMSTSALLDLFKVTGQERDNIESKRRAESVEITHQAYGSAWIRDNKPINETVLRRTLAGMSEEEWYRTLNSRVFFWLSEDRLDRLRNAPPYRDRKHEILTIDTSKLLDVYAEEIELSPLNSGAVHPSANYSRGEGTFAPIDSYPWQSRLGTAPREPIVELTVPYLVSDPSRFLIHRTTK